MKTMIFKNNRILIILISIVGLLIAILSSFRNSCFYDCSVYQVIRFYFILILVYIFPGYCISHLFSGSLRNNFFIYILGSMVIVPVLLNFFGLFFEINIYSIISLFMILYILSSWAGNKITNKLSLKAISGEENNKILTIYYLIFIFFLIMVVLPRFSLLMDRASPIPDDVKHLSTVTSIASSGVPPLYYSYPSSILSYYYYGYIQAGLITMLTVNFINVSQAWFFHVFIQTIISIWLVIQIARVTYKTNSGKILAILLMTFLAGYEFIIFLIYRIIYPSLIINHHLEWWTTWVGIFKPIYLQISSFYTLFLWVPQHLLAGLLIIVLFFLIFKTEGNKWMRSILIGLVLSAAFGYSVFASLGIFIPYTIWNFNNYIRSRKKSYEFILSMGIFFACSVYLIYIFSFKKSVLIIKIIHGNLFAGLNLFNFIPRTIINFVDFIVTIPLYLIIELGIIQFIGIILVIIWRKKILNDNESQFWFLTFILTFPLIFIISSLNFNDFGMRFIIPAQISLAILTVLVMENNFHLIKNKKYYALILCIIFISMTLPMFEFASKMNHFLRTEQIDPVLQKIDLDTPLSSIIFTNYTNYSLDNSTIPAYGHRLTFLPVHNFTQVNIQYTSESILNDIENFSDVNDICKYLISSNQYGLLKRQLYYLDSNRLNKFSCNK